MTRTNTSEEAHNGPYAGMVVDIMEEISKDLGFTYKMYEPKDLKYGSVFENGTGNGMVGELMRCVSKIDLKHYFKNNRYVSIKCQLTEI